MKLIGLLLFLVLFANCSEKETEYHPKAVVIIRAGDVKVGNKPVNLGDEITDKDTLVLGGKSICDLQILDSDSQVVIRLKEFSKFRLSGKQIGSKKETNFLIDAGNAMLNVPKLGKNDDFKTMSPSTTAGVRGTKYDVSVSPNGNTKVYVIEGAVAMKVHIPEMDKFSNSEIKDSKALTAVRESLDSKEIVLEQGKSTEMPKSVGTKIMKETGLGEAVKKDAAKDLDKDVDAKSLGQKMEKIESEELKLIVKEIDKNTMNQRLQEYAELTPIEKEVVNDKEKRKAVIQARYQKFESNWLQRLLKFLKF